MSEYCRDDFGLVEQADDDFKMWQGLVGPHYTPSVSEDGTLSWSNDGQLPNPEDVNIKGPPGEGEPGPGVPAGGTTGQLLAKASDEDYDGEWIDQPEMDAGHVSYDSTEAYDDGTVGKELTTINSALTSLSAVTEIIDTASGAIASFPDGAGLPMRSLLAQINPVQDLHGYDAPWAGGSGKNIVPPMTGTVTKNGITFTPDSEGCVAVSGTATATTATASGVFEVKAGVSYTLNGCPSGGGTSSYRLDLRDASNPDQLDQELQSYLDNGSGVSFTPSTTHNIRVGFRIANGYTVPSGIVFKPMIRLSSVSDATFAPYSNECPITGWTGLSGKRCGVNQWDEEWEVGAISTSTGQNTSSTTRIRSKNYVPVDPEKTFWFVGTGYNAEVLFYDKYKNFISKRSPDVPTAGGLLNQPSNCYFVRFTMYSGYGTTYRNDIGINCPSTDTAYHAYTSLPITCTWQTEAGTVYGGTVDVVSGVLTVTHRYVLLDGTQTINKHSTTAYNGFHLNLANNGLPACASTEDGTVGQFSYYKLGKLINANGNAFVGSNTIQFRNDSLTTKDEAIAYLTANPLQVVYPLATTQTYQLTPQQIDTLLGNNTVFVDCGSVSVTYQASIKGYIDKVLGA